MHRPSLILVETAPRRRLAALDTLRARFAVEVVGWDRRPLQHIRRRRPEVVVVSVPRFRSRRAMHLARTLKTELEPSFRVLLWSPRPSTSIRHRVATEVLADAYLEGEAHRLLEVAIRLTAGENPRVLLPTHGRLGWRS